MRRCERGRAGACASLVGAVLLSGCGSEPPVPASGSGAVSAEAPAPAGDVAAVRLDGMGANPSDPAPERRNPFRFGAATPARDAESDDEPVAAPAPAAPGEPSTPPQVAAPAGTPATGSAGVPLTFIGFVESPGIEGRVVVLTDGEVVFYGREGDVIDGRYRIVGIGLESVDLERIDGRGAQTLRLPGGPPGGS